MTRGQSIPQDHRRRQRGRRWRRACAALIVTGALLTTGGMAPGAESPAIEPSGQDAAASWTLQGRVYEGPLGDETRPLGAVTVSAYGGNDPWPVQGTFIVSTTTNSEGWYGLSVEEGFEYYHVRETNPDGYESVGATTVDGVVREADWIEYEIPLSGQTLTGNKFWDRPPLLSGRVYQGSVGDERTPLEGVTLTLHCSDQPEEPGPAIYTTTTDAEGWYGLWAYAGCGFYSIIEHDPSGYESVGATTVSGTVQDANWIQYAVPLLEQTLTGNKFWDRPPGALPDLLVTDLWREGDSICYQVLNVGTGPAEAGHVSVFFADGGEITAHVVETELQTDEAYEACAAWTCSGFEDAMEALVDAEGLLVEEDEGNNALEEVWRCDVTPPQIVSDVVVDAERDYAVVSWETNEESDGRVRYGTVAGEHMIEAEVAGLYLSHVITVTGLTSGTTYEAEVESRDPAGNAATSDLFRFETLPPLPGEGPAVTLEAPEVLTGTVTVTAAASADVGVERVVFELGGQRLLTDYASPYEVTIDTTTFPNGIEGLAAGAFDRAGSWAEDFRAVDVSNLKDASDPTVQITAPNQGDTVSGVVTVTAALTDDVGIVSARYYVDGDYQQFEPFDVTNPPKNATASFPWDTRALTNTESYRLGVEVYDAEGKHDVDTVDVVVNNVAPQPPPSPPWLEVTNHTLTRFQNRFIVGLRVKNTGDFEARNAVVRDGMIGFQPMARDAGDAEYLARYHPLGQYGYVEIKLKQNIAAGESRIFFYNVMPVMMHPTPSSPEVGSFVDMAWDSSTQTGYHNYVNQPIGLTTGGETVSKAHANAVKEADYLIVTNPYRLFLTFNPGVDRNKPYCDLLLSTMAELAFEKDGALGYIDTYSAATLRNLITSGGSWSSRMAPGWDSNGYLLLVGENQVVPGWSRYHGKQYTTQGNIPFTASPTDYPYASTSGSELKPELAMGRIIGESPALQIVAIRNSLYSYQGKAGYDYDALQTLAVNGFPACWHGGCDSIDFAHEVNSLPSVLSGTITGMRTPDLAQRDAQGNVVITPTKHAITTTFFTHSADKDIIFLAGHGSGGSWDVFNTGDILAQATPFGSHSPFVFASSCATGDYPGGLSFAESMLARRAAAYLGAVEKGACYTDGTCPHADTFFSNWSSSESFARALKQAKRKIGTSFFDRWWTAIYHLYGDAKFGSLSGLGGMGEGARAASAASAPPDWVPIDVPDYAITETDGADLVEIPGGDQLLVSGQPVVPVYRIFYDFGKEHQVADVRLVHRSEPVALNGLNVPSTTVALAGVGQTGSAEVTPHEPSWWPEQPFEWSVEEGPTTTTLAITVYPFVYDAVTRRGIFFQHYEFEIDHAPSSVAITRLETHRPSYEPGAPVLLELELQNEGSAHDVTVSGVIRRAGTGEVVGGLELRTLKVVEGPAAYTLVWDSAGAAPGSYTTVIDLSGGGVPLDSAQATFELGEGAAEVVGFDAEPAHVDVGEGVNVWLEISNTGAVSITGTLVIQVQGRVGELVAQFQESFAGVPPEGGAVLEAVWETAGVNPADFTLVGYGLFDGKATEPVATTVRVGRRVYLPLVLKTHAG